MLKDVSMRINHLLKAQDVKMPSTSSSPKKREYLLSLLQKSRNRQPVPYTNSELPPQIHVSPSCQRDANNFSVTSNMHHSSQPHYPNTSRTHPFIVEEFESGPHNTTPQDFQDSRNIMISPRAKQQELDLAYFKYKNKVLQSEAHNNKRNFLSPQVQSRNNVFQTLPVPAPESNSNNEAASANSFQDAFFKVYRQQVLALVKPMLLELEVRFNRKLQNLERELKNYIETKQQLHNSSSQQALQRAIKSKHNISIDSKQPPKKIAYETPKPKQTHEQIPQSQTDPNLAQALEKARLITEKMIQNQNKVVAKFRQIEDDIRVIKETANKAIDKVPQKCNCEIYLGRILETQHFLSTEVSYIKHNKDYLSWSQGTANNQANSAGVSPSLLASKLS